MTEREKGPLEAAHEANTQAHLARIARERQARGFTAEDVLILQEIAVDFDVDGFDETADALRSIANRIAAALPA